MQVAWRSTNATIQRVGIEMDGSEFYLRGQEKRSCCEPLPVTPSLFGESSLTTALTCEPANGRRESTAPHSEMKPASNLPTLYARRAQSLLIAGLIAGITPTSIRKRYGADCREAAFLLLDGDTSESAAIESEPEAEN